MLIVKLIIQAIPRLSGVIPGAVSLLQLKNEEQLIEPILSFFLSLSRTTPVSDEVTHRVGSYEGGLMGSYLLYSGWAYTQGGLILSVCLY